MKRAVRAVLLILLMSAVGMTKAMANNHAQEIGQKPSVTAMSATNITSNSATLRAKINPNGDVCAYVFEYGYTTSYGNTVGSGTLESGSSYVTVTFNLTGLNPNELLSFQSKSWKQ